MQNTIVLYRKIRNLSSVYYFLRKKDRQKEKGKKGRKRKTETVGTTLHLSSNRHKSDISINVL